MKKNWNTQTVTQMDPEEVVLFVLYRNQTNTPDGLTRDRLPYTQQFDRLLNEYNRRTRAGLSPGEFWEKLKIVLKPGEDRIEAYLRSANIPFPPKA